MVSDLLWAALIGTLVLLGWVHRQSRYWQECYWRALKEEPSNEDSVSNAELLNQQKLFDAMIAGVLVLKGDDTVQFANRALTHLFDLQGPVVGRGLVESIRHPELHEMVASCRRDGELREAELISLDVLDRVFQVDGTILEENQGQPGMILVFHDLTRLRRLERTRQEFVANVSHELRTPLSVIKGYAETLQSEAAWSDSDIRGKMIGAIDRNAERLSLLIEDLLDLSQLDAEQLTLELAPVDLSALVRRVVQDFEGRLLQRHCEVQVDLSPRTLINGDAKRLHQVFVNIIDNAIKYGSEPGRIVIGEGERKAGESGETIEIFVQDTGPGIPPDACERIFERFYRVDKARARKAGGTGLGLAIVKHIILLHQGEIRAESEVGKETRIVIRFPLQSASSGKTTG
jgi:two-component system phosphate regulon sensor histidine kinase PhoR